MTMMGMRRRKKKRERGDLGVCSGIQNDRRAHAGRRNRKDSEHQPVGASELRVEAERTAVLVRDPSEDVVDLREKQIWI
jgi:hypothetical protein